jgi:hypothetical protein
MSSSHTTPFDFLKNMPRYFWLLLAVFTVTAGILLMDHFRTYVSRVTIIVVQKNEKTAALADQTVDNIAELPKMLAFYNRLLKRFPEINDPWIGLSDDARRALWSQRVISERVDYSGLIRMQIEADTASDASLLSEKAMINLFETVGQYYNIRTEIDVRTVEPSITSVEIHNPFGWFLSSVSVGFVASVVVSSLIGVFSQGMMGRVRISAPFASGNSGKQEKVKTVLLPVTFDDVLSAEQTPLHEKLKTPIKTSVPNLPFLEEGISLEDHLFGFQGTPIDAPTEDISVHEFIISEAPTTNLPGGDESQKSTPLGEPTPEELKRRLNQLLNGDM